MIPAEAGGASSSGLVRSAASAKPGALVLGRYIVHGEIASGGMASVYHGRLTSLGGFRREVAIKRLHRHLARDPEFVAMFLDEARLAARVVHPNVVPMLDVVSNDDETFLVMDYVPGVPLSQLIRIVGQRCDRVPVGIAVAVAVGVLRGLHAAHEAKDDRGEALEIVHRDVSPQNVIVGSDGIARLLDFGVAKAVVRLQTTREGRVKGKSSYMAPEQVTGAEVTRSTDVYSAAVVLWETLTGQRLYTGGTDANILFRVVTEAARAPSSVITGIPAALDAIVLRGMARDVLVRYATASEMADDLESRVGVATPKHVAAWLASVAGDVMDERARQIAALERAAVPSDQEPTTIASVPRAPPPDLPATGDRSAMRPRPSAPSAPNVTALAAQDVTEAPPPASMGTQTAAEIPDEAPQFRRRVPLVVWLAPLLVMGVAAAMVLRAPSSAEPAPSVTVASSAAELPVVAAPPVASSASSLLGEAPSAPASAAPVASAVAAPPASAAPIANGAVRAPPLRAGAPDNASPQIAPRRRPRPASAPPPPDCVPYAVDAKGHTHFNPKCL